jgi:hypothetical protein
VDGPQGTIFRVSVCLLALVFTAIVWSTLASLKKRSDFLTSNLRKGDLIYDAYLKKATLGSTELLANHLPILCMFAWIGMLVVVLLHSGGKLR